MRTRTWMVVAAVIVVCAGVVLLSARSDNSSDEAIAGEPAQVEPIEGTDLNRVTLTADAAKRLGIETATVARRETGGRVVPYGAVLYDAEGQTFTYTSPEPLVFVRSPISVRYIKRGRAVISRGPPAGTEVVIVGSQELFGTEYEVEED
jgi:hypothetical protein